MSIVVVVGLMRSGTTVFRHLLEISGGTDLGETFANLERDFTHSFFHYARYRASRDFRVLHPDNYEVLFDSFLAERAGLPSPLIVDIKIRQSSVFDFGHAFGKMAVFDFLMRKNAHFVRVIRRNLLRARISHEIARQTDVWYILQEEPHPPSTALALDTRWLVNLLEEDSHLIATVAQKLPTALIVYYEDMFTPSGAVTNDVAALISSLGGRSVSASDLSESLDLRKQNPEPLKELLSNYDEVREVLAGSDFEWMIDE